jgi:hypothetical protein
VFKMASEADLSATRVHEHTIGENFISFNLPWISNLSCYDL